MKKKAGIYERTPKGMRQSSFALPPALHAQIAALAKAEQRNWGKQCVALLCEALRHRAAQQEGR
jgi:hypothetical protein